MSCSAIDVLSFWGYGNNFSTVNADDSVMELMEILLNCKNEEEVIQLAGGNEDREYLYLLLYRQSIQLFAEFEDEVDTMVTKLLIIGASMFIGFGLSKFLWNYVGMRQMHHLKEKYFSIILRQEQVGSILIMLLNLVQKYKLNLNK